MAREQQRLPNGQLQWRDTAAGVQGWNNIDREDDPDYKKAAPAPPPQASPASNPGPASAALSGLSSAGPAPPPEPAAKDFPSLVGGAGGSSSLMPTTPSPDSAGAAGSGIITQGGMIPGPGFVESGMGAGALRGLGQRRPPQESMALAGLSRAY